MSFSLYYPPTVKYDVLQQRPHHLLKYLARLGATCYFCEPQVPGRPIVREIEENFVVLNGFMQTTFKRPLALYFTYPPHLQHVGKIKEDIVVFDTLDEPAEEFAHWEEQYVASLTRADVVLASAIKLYDAAKQHNSNVHLVTNAVEYERFAAARTKGKVPVMLRKLDSSKITVGFYGAIATWIDFDLIKNAALQRPNWNFVVIGPTYNYVLENLPPNVTRLQHIPYQNLPEYLSIFDVCLVPFKKSLVAESCNPLKMWEYLAAGKPIVTTNIVESEGKPGVYQASVDNFVDKIDQALSEDSLLLRDARQAIALQNSWEEKAKIVYNEILRCFK